MMPFKSLLTMASSEDSTMAASRCTAAKSCPLAETFTASLALFGEERRESVVFAGVRRDGFLLVLVPAFNVLRSNAGYSGNLRRVTAASLRIIHRHNMGYSPMFIKSRGTSIRAI